VPLFGELDVEWLTPGPGRDLLTHLLAASAELGRAAVASLLAADSEDLSEAQRALLLQLSAESGWEDAAVAHQSVSDRICDLRCAALDRQKSALDARLKSCTDAADQTALMEEVQRIVMEKHDLRKRQRHL
jgi:hypothetical protein